MPSLSRVLAIGVGALTSNVAAIPSIPNLAAFTKGLEKPVVVSSVGGHATCIVGNIPGNAPAMNTELKYPIPANRKRRSARSYILCCPCEFKPGVKEPTPSARNSASKSAPPPTHSRSNSSPTASASINLIGTSSPLHTATSTRCSSTLHDILIRLSRINIAYSLIQSLRSGAIASRAFKSVIGVGHSLGSLLNIALTAQYPNALSAAVLIAFSNDVKGQSVFSSLDLTIARQNAPARFPLLNKDYTISHNIKGNQFASFRLPNFDPVVLLAAEATKQTFALGELFTSSEFVNLADKFTGPVYVVDGENDLPFCQSNCLVPDNKAQTALKILYPIRDAGSGVYIGKGLDMA
ncbi:hypothetical protein VTL71DRAFT_8745 [Oculimacula yallundae]|uniref:AB hydrolase-1 domain-containing protein n=1 Tax=Oculimacula yallundae TaxID=86028 RepID=A0ABR4CYG6_9HELO